MVIPTRRLNVVEPKRAVIEILEYASVLVAAGERPWFEVWYPAPEYADAAEWDASQPDSFDAVEVIDGQIHTLPPYAELEANR